MTTHYGPSIFDIRVRLRPDDVSGRTLLDTRDARPFAEGIISTLAVRGVAGDRAIATSEITNLGWDIESTWSTAWAQTRTMERPQETNIIDVDGLEIVHLYSDHPYGASFVPYLHDVLDGDQRVGSSGALVSMPIEHSIVVLPIHNDQLLQAAQAMIPITRQVHRSGPASLSAHVYWWREGSLTWVPTYFARDGMEFYPPAELAELIEPPVD